MVLLLGARAAVSEPAAILETLTGADSCVGCHQNPGFRVSNPKLYYYFTGFAQSKHHRAGVSCAACHGGDPKVARHDKDAAHVGVLAPSDPRSKVHFKKVPATCGACHEAEYAHFSSSQHFKSLQSEGDGPNCVTCHGSRISQVFYTEIVETTCETCHDGQKLDDVSQQARAILHRLKVAQGLMSWTRLYAYNSTSDWSDDLDKLERRHRRVTEAWHRFEFNELEKETTELLAELQSLFAVVWEKRNSASPYDIPIR
jgi:hypothetical protein